MPLIDQIKAMQQQGIEEGQIVQNLQEQGHSPAEINQAIEQSRIKAAASSEPATPGQAPGMAVPGPETAPAIAPGPPVSPTQELTAAPEEEMQPSAGCGLGEGGPGQPDFYYEQNTPYT